MARSKLTKQLVKDALIKSRLTVEMLKDSTNPQSIDIRNQAYGRMVAFESVLIAMGGDTSLIRIYSNSDYSRPL